MNEMSRCPFSPGQRVIYLPSQKAKDADAMTSLSEKLTPGSIYIVKAVSHDVYVTVQGYSHPGGGLYWTEFQQAT
jgi:hypothetical protein